MAYAQPRSANRELEQGMIDGSYKQAVKDRGGQVENATWYHRDELSYIYYGICEAPMFDTPDAQKMVSPYRTVTPNSQSHDNESMEHVLMYEGR